MFTSLPPRRLRGSAAPPSCPNHVPAPHSPHYTVPVSPQCPQEISLLTLPVLQGAAVSSKHFYQFLPLGNVAELRGSPPLWGSLEQLEQPSPAGPPRTGCHERSRRRILPISILPHHRKFLRCALGAKRINIGFFPPALHSFTMCGYCAGSSVTPGHPHTQPPLWWLIVAHQSGWRFGIENSFSLK